MNPDTNDDGNSRWSKAELSHRRVLEAHKRVRDERDERRSPLRILNGYHYVSALLRMTGLYGAGHRTYLSPIFCENEIPLRTLPEAFDGFRILQLSDMHFDLDPELAPIAKKLLEGAAFDLCVVTGDFRDRLTPSGEIGIRLTLELLAGIRPVYACLGNHDLASDVETLEKGGIRVLVNESVRIERGGASIYLCGVDDPGYFRTDDFGRAYRDVPDGAFSIVLSHDPGAYAPAAQRKAALMLSGHTHGGQMALPGGFAPSTHSTCKRNMVCGAWSYGDMEGYTTSGLGGSRVPARFFTRGEVVIHTLRKSAQ
jgi:predicted MPP superfamily phosphohydrolase